MRILEFCFGISLARLLLAHRSYLPVLLMHPSRKAIGGEFGSPLKPKFRLRSQAHYQIKKI